MSFFKYDIKLPIRRPSKSTRTPRNITDMNTIAKMSSKKKNATINQEHFTKLICLDKAHSAEIQNQPKSKINRKIMFQQYLGQKTSPPPIGQSKPLTQIQDISRPHDTQLPYFINQINSNQTKITLLCTVACIAVRFHIPHKLGFCNSFCLYNYIAAIDIDLFHALKCLHSIRYSTISQ